MPYYLISITEGMMKMFRVSIDSWDQNLNCLN